jgi:ACS family glucarate transporter-like MFS transporter
VLGLLVLMSVLLYLDRFAIGAVTPRMIDELDVDEEQFGRAVGAFFLAYALLQVPAGWLADRLGARSMLTLYVMGWSLCTIGIGLVHGLLALTTCRALLGVTQAGAYPAAAAVIKRWIPLSSRARANSAVSTGGRLGGLMAFALTPLLVQAVAIGFGFVTGQWRPVFILYGLVGLAWCVAFWRSFRDSPAEHPRCERPEQKLIAAGATPVSAPSRAVPLSALFGSLNLYFLCAINFFLNFGWIFLATWLTTYFSALNNARDEPLENMETLAGLLTAATAVAGMTGNLFGGWLGDYCTRRFGLHLGRRLPGIASGFLAAGVYLLASMTDNIWLFAFEMAAIYFLADLALGSLWAVYQDIGGASTASVLGFANMCGNLGAAVFSWQIGALAKGGDWSTVFYLSSTALALMAVCWLIVDPTRSLVRNAR